MPERKHPSRLPEPENKVPMPGQYLVAKSTSSWKDVRQKALDHGQFIIPVIDITDNGDKRFLGFVRPTDNPKGSGFDSETVSVGEVVAEAVKDNPVRLKFCVPPQAKVSKARWMMAMFDVVFVPVVDEGEFKGIIDLEDVND